MEPYLFYGVVLPERAQLSLKTELLFQHVTSAVEGRARISIVLNQVVVWVETEPVWDIFDLRNVVKNVVQAELALVGYLAGHAYDFELTRVLNRDRKVDYVFGIDIPCLVERGRSIDLVAELSRLRPKTAGPNGMLLRRCFNDLMSSMKYADDTGFYCYRAIESLRHHCSAVHGLSGSDKSVQWAKFREVSGNSHETLQSLKRAAEGLRHGEGAALTSGERAGLLTNTWDVVDRYLNSIGN